jgi:hypothetical protein
LQGEEVADAAVEDAVEAGFVAVDEVELGGGGEGREAGGEAHVVVPGGLLGEAGVEELGFDGPDAARAPLGEGHLLDDGGFDFGGGA